MGDCQLMGESSVNNQHLREGKMLWWDDSFQREHGCQRPKIDEETIACFRSTKSVRIPKKVVKKQEPKHKGWELAPQWTGTPHWTGESDALVPNIVEPVVEIRIPEMMFELKRGSMKEKWGLSIAFREGPGGRVELGVSKVAMFSPAAKAGIEAGNTLVRVNDWKIEAIQKCETTLSLLLAAGFSVKLAWLTSKKNCTQEGLTGWVQLQII